MRSYPDTDIDSNRAKFPAVPLPGYINMASLTLCVKVFVANLTLLTHFI